MILHVHFQVFVVLSFISILGDHVAQEGQGVAGEVSVILEP